VPTSLHWIAFAAVALGFAVTPGPNMIYTISRALCQGAGAALISLLGIALAFAFYMLCAVFGITALLMTVPFAYDALRIAGALYLLYLAWQSIRPGGRSPFEVRQLPPDTPARLVLMGFLTNLLNPKAAVLYLSLLPQFIHPEEGHVLGQALALGCTQVAISMLVNGCVALGAGAIALFLARRPLWLAAQRWLMGGVLGGLALRMATEARR